MEKKNNKKIKVLPECPIKMEEQSQINPYADFAHISYIELSEMVYNGYVVKKR